MYIIFFCKELCKLIVVHNEYINGSKYYSGILTDNIVDVIEEHDMFVAYDNIRPVTMIKKQGVKGYYTLSAIEYMQLCALGITN